jgi:hypothetical protein
MLLEPWADICPHRDTLEICLRCVSLTLSPVEEPIFFCLHEQFGEELFEHSRSSRLFNSNS